MTHLAALGEHFSVAFSTDDELGPEPFALEDETLQMGATTQSLVSAKPKHERRKAATDHQNPEFLKAKAAYKPRDNVQANIAATKPLHPPLKVEKWWETETRPVYVYSGQRLQYTEMQKEQIRERAQKDPENHYTYSQTYLTGSL